MDLHLGLVPTHFKHILPAYQVLAIIQYAEIQASSSTAEPAQQGGGELQVCRGYDLSSTLKDKNWGVSPLHEAHDANLQQL